MQWKICRFYRWLSLKNGKSYFSSTAFYSKTFSLNSFVNPSNIVLFYSSLAINIKGPYMRKTSNKTLNRIKLRCI